MLKTENKKGVFGQVLTCFCFVMEIIQSDKLGMDN